MERIYTSATKLVLLMVSATVCAAFLLGKLGATEFTPVVTMVIGYYFGASKGQKDDVNMPDAEKADPIPYSDARG